MKANGSPDSIIEADDEHTYFIIRIPCHPEFVCDELSMDKEGHILPAGEVWTPDVTDDVTDNVTDKVIDNDDITSNVIDDVTDVTDNVTDGNTAEKRRLDNLLRANGKLRREGDDRNGIWVVIE